jgi:hypothetical protein
LPPAARLNESAARARHDGTKRGIERATPNAGNVSSKASQRHRPLLTRQRLHAIGELNRGNADVQALLWEIHRLRAIALRAEQLLRSMPNAVDTVGLVANALRNQLDGEPAVVEQRAATEALIAKTRR